MWDPLLQPLQQAFTCGLTWSSLLYFTNLKPTPQAKEKYGFPLFAVLNLVHAIVTRCIWMHRNDIRFHDQAPNPIETQERIAALLKLHIRAYQQALQEKSHRNSTLALRQLKQLVQDTGFRASETDED